jgi:hypothetical protein
MYSYGWDDACWTECGFGEERPLRFENIEQAEAAIVELLADVRAAVAAGHMVCESSARIIGCARFRNAGLS